MSANPNNAEAGWGSQPAEVPAPGLVPANGRADDPANDSGSNALQALLAFACLHEQAAQRRALKNSAASLENAPALQASSASKAPKEREEEFALDEVLQLVAARAVAITGADGVAIALAEEGMPVTAKLSKWLENAAPLLSQWAESAATYLPEQRAPRPGERLRQPNLARLAKRADGKVRRRSRSPTRRQDHSVGRSGRRGRFVPAV